MAHLSEQLNEALFDIADKYEAAVTNNEPRIQNGQQLRHVGDFIGDIKEAFLEAGWTPPDA